MNRPLKLATTVCIAVAATVTVSTALAVTFDYAFIADNNTPIPGGTGTFDFANFPFPGISNGNVLFRGKSSGGQVGIYSHRAGVLDVVFNQDTPIPDGTGMFTDFGHPTFSPDFNITFRGEGTGAQLGIYSYSDASGELSVLADRNTDVPGTGGAEQFTNFSTPWMYDDEIVFRGLGSGGTDGIYTNAGGSLRVVADTSTNIPDGTGQFTGFGGINSITGQPLSTPSIAGGDIAFRGDGTGGQEGIYAEFDGTLIRVADKTTPVPGFVDPFPGFSGNIQLAANIRDGEIVFIGDDIGLFKYAQGSLSTIVDINTVNPDTGGTLIVTAGQGYGFHDGDVSFLGDDTVGSPAIFAVLDGQLTTVLSRDDVIEGRVVGSAGTYGQGIENGAVAANIGGASGANVVAIQEHRWLGSGSSTYGGAGSGDHWDDPGNWPFGLLPRNIVPTVIDPAGDVTVHGPHEDVSLSSLQVGGGTGIATLWLHGGAVITVPTTTITPTGLLAGNGEIVGDVVNNGLIRPENVVASNIQNNATINLATTDARLQATGGVVNKGVVTGVGTLLANLGFENHADGEVRVGDGEQLQIGGDSFDNAGRIEAIGTALAPAEIEIDGAVTNDAKSGEVFARNALLRFRGGLTNHGLFSMSFGTSDVFGDITNSANGKIIVSGNSNTTFYDDVVNDGELRTSAGTAAVFFGDVSGSGMYTGTGTVFFEGLFSPGSSPAAVSIAADAVLGPGSMLEVELGGLTPGSEYDQLLIGGTATLGGTLLVSLIDGFQPQVGDQFDVLAYGSLDGAFHEVEFTGALDGLLDYGESSLTLTITAVPEPTCTCLLALGIVAGFCLAGVRHGPREDQ